VLSVTHAHSNEIDLVNEVVIAIRGSLDAYRRELVKEIFVQFPTYEVAHALDEDLSKRIGDDFSSSPEQQRLVAILLALKDLGSLTFHDRGRETWFFFDESRHIAARSRQTINVAASDRIGDIRKHDRYGSSRLKECRHGRAATEKMTSGASAISS
jgi:hypothetical protein